VRALACPASLKHVLTAGQAAAALAAGLRAGGAETRGLPLADGGEGTAAILATALGGRWREAAVHDAFGAPRRARWLELPDGTAVVEAAEAIPLDPARLDVAAASSRGLGELLLATGRPRALLVALGGTATMDAGEGLREVLEALPAPTRVACDVRSTLLEAPRLYGPQKGASPAQVEELTRRFAALPLPRELPGGGAAGGLGAALAVLGAELVPGAELVLDLVGFDPSGYDLVVTGEGRVDATTREGKVPAAVAARCAAAGVRCVVFGGRVDEPLPGVETVALSGDPARAREDLAGLGLRLARLGLA
jgi:glycerate kinase